MVPAESAVPAVGAGDSAQKPLRALAAAIARS
jgi:hypothetical protein